MSIRWADFSREFAPVRGSVVSLEGPERRSSPVTSDGDYFFDALPHGTYTLRVPFQNAPYLETPDPATFTLDRDQPLPCADLT
jgi:hypothetical protein